MTGRFVYISKSPIAVEVIPLRCTENRHVVRDQPADCLDLVDIWRKLFPNRVRYTHLCSQYKVGTRINRFYVGNAIYDYVKDARIIPCAQSDHNAITRKIVCSNSTKGPGLCQLNTSILNDKNYVRKIDAFWKHWKTKKDKFDDIKLWWDAIVGKVHTLECFIKLSA